jgi:hypothetical protein
MRLAKSKRGGGGVGEGGNESERFGDSEKARRQSGWDHNLQLGE